MDGTKAREMDGRLPETAARVSGRRPLFSARGLHLRASLLSQKSKVGIKTPKRDLELIRARLADAELHFKTTIGKED